MTTKLYTDKPFFVPAAEDAGQAQRVWKATKKFAEENSRRDIRDERIFSIRYVHEGKLYYAEVGQPDPRVKETVLVILDSDPYYVCTFNRGVSQGIPVLVGRNEATDVTYFM